MPRLFAGNLSFEVDAALLRATFAEYGAVGDVKIITDRDTGKSKGFGFVDMTDEDAARGAIQALNGTMIEGRRLVVEIANPKPVFRGDDGRRAGAGHGGRDQARRW